jgi:uncharacterized protein with NRDE domain
MCTLTYIPLKKGFIITSNRDEMALRPTAKPRAYDYHGQKLIFPKDEIAGGTWIAYSSRQRIACLLNGAFDTHVRKESYAKSRGLVLLEAFEYPDLNEFIEKVNLENVEPFTLLLIDFQQTFQFKELVWDGNNMHVRDIDNKNPGIWSSATLYSKENRALRRQWFDTWLKENKDKEDNKILDFHFFKHIQNPRINVVMKGEKGLQTVSITQILINENQPEFHYFDLIDGTETKVDLNIL